APCSSHRPSRSRKERPDPATRSLTVDETSTVPGSAVAATRAAMVFAVMGGDDLDAGPVPRWLVAVTVHRYCLPLVRFVTGTGLFACTPVFVMPPSGEVQVAW